MRSNDAQYFSQITHKVYEHFRAQGEVSSDLCFSGTRDCRAGTEPKKKSKKSKKSASEKKQEKPKTNSEAQTLK